MKNSIWRQCKRKNRYRDEHEANYHRKMYERERGVKLDYYWCHYCNGYHLTSIIAFNSKYYNMSTEPAVTVG